MGLALPAPSRAQPAPLEQTGPVGAPGGGAPAEEGGPGAEPPSAEADPEPEQEGEPAPKPDSPSAPQAASPAEEISPAEALDQARQAFQRLRFTEISPLLAPKLEPESQFARREPRLEARALLGLGLFFEAEASPQPEQREALRERAAEHFLALLREDPDHELDPLIYPASVVEYFEQVRQENAEELDRLRARQGDGDEGAVSETVYIERAVRERTRALAFAPLGVGQFQNGDEFKGGVLATLQGVSLAANVTSYVWLVSLWRQQPGGKFPRDPNNPGRSGAEKLQADRLRVSMYVSLAVFLGLYVYGVADALYFYEHEDLLRLRTLDEPPPELAPDARLPDPGGLWLEWSWRF